MSNKTNSISVRECVEIMRSTTAQVREGKANVSIGSMAIGEFKAILAMYRLQLDESRQTGTPIETPLLDMS